MWENKILEIIKSKTEVKELCLTDEFFNDLGLSSLDMMSLLLDIEQKLEISIVLTDMATVKTVQDLLNCLKKYNKVI